MATANDKPGGSKYKRLDPREHVLLRPGMYIGSVSSDKVTTWVLLEGTAAAAATFEKREVEYVPGLYKIFDEILVNAIDHGTALKLAKKSDDVQQMRGIKVVIDRATNEISVENDGDGIDVSVHPEYGIHIPELIFGHMLTSSNYDDEDKERVIGGQNGIGAKACNIFSKAFTIETVDARQQKRYRQTFRDNMTVREPPKITSAANKKPFTRITFTPDFKRFGLSGITDDLYALFAKRCYDACALTDRDVSVWLDDRKLEIKTFERYVDLYFTSSPSDDGKRKLAYEAVSTPWGEWEIAATYNDTAAFDHVSFVNGVATIRGGKHVDFVANQVAGRMAETISKKRKELDIKPSMVKNHLFVFVKAHVPNPTFDSQSKETLTTPSSKFGAKVELSDKFFDRLSKTGLVERVVEMSEASRAKDMKKTDGKKRTRITGIVKLEDANWAGDKTRSRQCTLILTEGDSAKSTAIAGLSVVGSDKYGVFPLRGKLLNVKDAPTKKLLENEEINHLKTILGLETGKNYQGVDDLRYGRIMIMTDQDVDGSHIKGLIFNLFETLWPSLLRSPAFLTSMLTPIVKVRKASTTKSFYTLQDFEAWKASAEARNGSWDIKYYKGLGTSTNAEAKEYFKDMKLVTYDCEDPKCKNSLDLAFNKKRANDRKTWLRAYDKDGILDYAASMSVSFDEFVNRDLVHFSKYDLERSIPHVQDGLKVSQRKILFTCFKTNMVKEEKVFMLSAGVAKTSAYHHGDASLYQTIVGLAQDYVGSNNVNLLEPIGQFGTRRQGGKDAASARYICTKPAKITDLIFRPEDRPILTYLSDDGISVEPEFYVPIIPMILVNGALGIGTGFSTSIPSYDPLKILRVLKTGNFAAFDDMMPWYRGFNGKITLVDSAPASKAARLAQLADGFDEETPSAKKYATHGIMKRTGPKTVSVTELPIAFWTDDFKELLEELLEKKPSPSSSAPGLAKYDVQYKDPAFEFVLTFSSADGLDAYIASGKLAEDLRLSSTRNNSTGNMYLFNEASQITKYDNIRAIVEEFARTRLRYYGKRRAFILAQLREENRVLKAKSRFIEEVVARKIEVGGQPMDKIVEKLRLLKHEMVENSYDYLLRMPIASLTLERKAKLDAELDANNGKIKYYSNTSDRELWILELDELEAALQASSAATPSFFKKS